MFRNLQSNAVDFASISDVDCQRPKNATFNPGRVKHKCMIDKLNARVSEDTQEQKRLRNIFESTIKSLRSEDAVCSSSSFNSTDTTGIKFASCEQLSKMSKINSNWKERIFWYDMCGSPSMQGAVSIETRAHLVILFEKILLLEYHGEWEIAVPVVEGIFLKNAA